MVVSIQGVGSNDEVTDARIVGKHDLDGQRSAASPRALIEDVRDGLRGEGIAAVRFGDGRIEIRSSVGVEQVKKSGGGAAEMSAVEGDLAKEGVGARAAGNEAIATAMITGFAFVAREGREVGLVLDLLAHVP